MSKRLRVSPTEYYNARRSENDSGIRFMLTPYSCLRQMYFQIDKTNDLINVVFQGQSLYQGELDIDKIREELLKKRKINYVEFVTMMTIIANEPYVNRRAGSRLRPFESLVYSLSYEPPWERKRKIDEILKDADPYELELALEEMLDELPWPLREALLDNMRDYFPFDMNKTDDDKKKKKRQKEKAKEKVKDEADERESGRSRREKKKAAANA